MSGQATEQPGTSELPRVVIPDLLWTGGCLPFNYRGEMVHGHFSIYLVRGGDKTILIATGHPVHWKEVERDVEQIDRVCPSYGYMIQGQAAVQLLLARTIEELQILSKRQRPIVLAGFDWARYPGDRKPHGH